MSSQDHRELNQAHKYFHLSDEVGPGLPLWLPAGVVLRDELEKLARELEFIAGYQRVVSPHIAKEKLYFKSGHLPYYEEGIFPAMELEESESYRLRPMCCPHHHMIYGSSPRSYRHLPLRFAEYGQVYRYERSGVLSGLMRARGLCQNDAHIYCRENQIKGEIHKVLNMYLEAYRILGLSDYRLRLSKGSTADSQKFVKDPERWLWAEGLLREVLVESGLPFEEASDEAAFYGPKIDVQLANVAGREETASTVQLDFISAERFDLQYINERGEKERPCVIHRAPLGSHERMVAMLIEKYQAAFPLWLSPVQLQIIPIADRHTEFARKLENEARAKFLRVRVDDRPEALSRKLAEVHQQKVPMYVVIGDKEMASGQFCLQERGNLEKRTLAASEIFADLRARIDRREK